MEEGLIEALSKEDLESIKKNGVPFGLWERYRNLFDWRLTLSKGFKSDITDIEFVNGEFLRDWPIVSKDDSDI